MTDNEIRERAIAHGFKRKLQPDGSMDLSPYVFNAIRACQPQWISVDERLPELYKRVLVKSDCYLVASREPKTEHNEDWGIDGEWMWAIVNDSWCDSDLVTHWMPLPEPPKGDNND